MLDIDSELLSNLDFGHIEILDTDIVEIKNILDKYNIKVESTLPIVTSELTNEALINFIIELYVNNKDIPGDISYLIKYNISFRLFLNKFVKNSMKNIINDKSTIVYKEIFIIINLLSFGNDYKIFKHYNFYSIGNIKKLFSYYEEKLYESFKDKDHKEFDLVFQSYIILIEIFIELCIINSLDVQRKKTISQVVDCLLGTISNIQSTIKLVDIKVYKLNNVLGKLLLYFSYVSYMNIDKRNLNYIVQRYIFILKKMLDGYKLLRTNKEEVEFSDNYYLTFLDKITTLLLTFIFKVESQDFEGKELLFQNDFFIELIKIYNIYSYHKFENKDDSLENLKIHLLNNYAFIYNSTAEKDITGGYIEIVNLFIKSKNFSRFNMSILHNIILFDNKISKEKIDLVLETLLSSKKIMNDYYEFFKLKIIDSIIQIFINDTIEIKENKYIKQIILYIENNKSNSHLLSMYSKIYLSLSHYYSIFDKKIYIDLSKEYYSLYTSIDNYVLLNSEYNSINYKILENYGKYFLKSLGEDGKKLTLENFILIGRKNINDYLENRNSNIKQYINKNFTKLTSSILKNDIKKVSQINEVLNTDISKKLFYGLVVMNIEKDSTCSLTINDLGFDCLTIKLDEKYKISFYYSKTYTNVFNSLYENNVEYIKDNLFNIITCYEKSIPSYIDTITLLPNLNQLKIDLNTIESEIIFIELYVNTLVEINKNNTYKKSNDFFCLLCKDISEITKAYRLTGPRLGIIIQDEKEYKEIINKINNIKTIFDNKEYSPKFTIAVSFGTTESILDKSYYCLSAATLKEEKYHEFR